jgi:hypothetical protein
MFVGGRRHFLKSSAGLLFSIPFLPSMAEAQVADKRLRFITARSPQGTYKDNFRPNLLGIPAVPIAGEALSYDINRVQGPLSATFGPEFNALKSKINFYQRLDPMVSASGHNHSTFLTSYQRCTNADSSELSLSEAPAGKEYIMPPKPSIDQLISALAFGKPYPVHNVVMSGYEYNVESFSYSYGYSGSRIVRVRGFYDPAMHFQKFFGGATSSTTVMNAKLDRRKLVVDQVLESYKSFVGKRSLSSMDKHTLDEHMEFLSGIQKRLSSGGFLVCKDPGIAVDPKLLASNSPTEKPELIELVYKLVVDIAVAAMRCDAIRVFNFSMYNSGANVAGGGPHGYHHMEKTEANKKAYATGHDVFYGKMLAYLANQLNSIRDPDGATMLDNSLLLYGKEMSNEGPEHVTWDMALATIGSLGGKIKTGQLLDYTRKLLKPNQPYGDLTQGRSYNQFLTSIMQGGFGLLPTQFETDNDFGQRIETIWGNTPLMEKRVLIPGMFT